MTRFITLIEFIIHIFKGETYNNMRLIKIIQQIIINSIITIF